MKMRAVHSFSEHAHTQSRGWSLAAALALAGMFVIVPVIAATASVGSVPDDVTEFSSADDGLIVELEEYFGVNQRGAGLDLSEGIEVGKVDRIFLWSENFREGVATETPVQYVNRWKVPVLIGDERVGIAMIGIDPATVDPEMIDFVRGAGVVIALEEIDKDATLVHEPDSGAWFSVTDDVVLPLVQGTSEATAETTLADYQSLLSSRVVDIVEPEPQPDQGSVQSVVVIVAAAVALVLALLIPTIIGQVRQRGERNTEVKAATAEARAGAAIAPPGGAIDMPTVGGVKHPENTAPHKAPQAATSTKQSTKAATPARRKPAAKTSSTKISNTKKPASKPSAATAATTKVAPKGSSKSASNKSAGASTAAAATKTTDKNSQTMDPASAKRAAAEPAPKKPKPSVSSATKPRAKKSNAKSTAKSKPKKPAAQAESATKKGSSAQKKPATTSAKKPANPPAGKPATKNSTPKSSAATDIAGAD